MIKIIMLLLGLALFVIGCTSSSLRDVEFQKTQEILVKPPYLPAHQQRSLGPPQIIQVRLVTEEKEIEIADGVYVQAATFNGSIPGPIIVAHQDDYIELTLVNLATNQHMHNIDLHAATGALGGGGLTKVNPGEQVTFRFKATKPGVFVYHCAPGGPLIPYHVVSGMNGAIMILPREGLKDEKGKPVYYDKAYYIGEQDFYIPTDRNGEYKRYTSLNDAFSETLQVMQGLIPSHVVLNGKVGALTGTNALTANVGEKVLLLHSQANRDSRPHLIGGQADLVWQGGSFNDRPITNQETWFIPGGSAVAEIYEFKQPGTYVYLNHNLNEAMLLGAAAQIKVNGEWNNDLMQQLTLSKINK